MFIGSAASMENMIFILSKTGRGPSLVASVPWGRVEVWGRGHLLLSLPLSLAHAA